jgi:hypothetical protein
MPPPHSTLVEKLQRKSNWLFLRRLYRLPKGAKIGRRLKVINSGNKKQREFLIQMLHHVVTGEIPIHSDHAKVIPDSGKRPFLELHFQHAKDVDALLGASDKRQKEILAQVNNFHVLLHYVFHQHYDD